MLGYLIWLADRLLRADFGQRTVTKVLSTGMASGSSFMCTY